MLNKGDILTLDNDKNYIVAATAILDNNVYVYLLNDDDLRDIKFCLYNKTLTIIQDEETLAKLVNLFLKDIQSF